MVSPLAMLGPEERVRFDSGAKSFGAGQFAEALPVFQDLLKAHPGDLMLSKFAAEASLETRGTAYALSLLTPLEASHPDDWQIAGLLARVYAETGDEARRDGEFGRLAALHQRGLTPKIVQQYVVEKVRLEGKTVLIFNSFEPWGNYKVCHYARVFNGDGKLMMRLTVETADFDQPQFAKEHAEEAAAGGRRYSFDGYVSGEPNAAGQRAETHFTYGFVDKKPTYDEVKVKFVAIVEGKKRP